MPDRELVVLGTAGHAATRTRNPNGYLLRWNGYAILFDPGEGTDRQLMLMGISVSKITHICLTHFHADHCLGLPAILHRAAVDNVQHPLEVLFPIEGQPYFDRLTTAWAADTGVDLRPHPVGENGVVARTPQFTLFAQALDHRTPTVGWRLEEPDRLSFDRTLLDRFGIAGPEVGRLAREGSLTVGERVVTVAEVTRPLRGQVFAFVMDTRMCDGAGVLAHRADLLVAESTYLEAEAALAAEYKHLTAAQAAGLARDAGARNLVLTHYSSRHPDPAVYEQEATAVFPAAVGARDLDVVPIPPRLES